MRLRIEVATAATELAWAKVLAPGRSLVYDLLAREAPEIGKRFHGEGAETLGLDPEVSLTEISGVGSKRSFAVGQGLKPGAPIEVELTGLPETLQAIWSWGLGQANTAGFGWIAA